MGEPAVGRASVTRLLDGAFGLGTPCRKLGTRQFEEQALSLESRWMGAAARRGREFSIACQSPVSFIKPQPVKGRSSLQASSFRLVGMGRLGGRLDGWELTIDRTPIRN